MSQYLGLFFFGHILVGLLISLYSDWKNYRFKLFEPKLEKIPIKNTYPKITKKTIKFQNHVINSSIRTKI